MKEVIIGSYAQSVTIVNSTNTAIAVGSGSLPVYATPALIALMEQATCRAIFKFLEDGDTTVGISVNVSHTRASSIGTEITATAVISECDGRKITFDVKAEDKYGNIIGFGKIERFAVIEEKFMKKVESHEI